MTLSAISALAGNKSHVFGSRDGTLRRFYRAAIFGLLALAAIIQCTGCTSSAPMAKQSTQSAPAAVSHRFVPPSQPVVVYYQPYQPQKPLWQGYGDLVDQNNRQLDAEAYPMLNCIQPKPIFLLHLSRIETSVTASGPLFAEMRKGVAQRSAGDLHQTLEWRVHFQDQEDRT